MKIAPQFVDSIRQLIANARGTVARGVDIVQVHTNFEIGRRIVEEEQRGRDRAEYGKAILETLASGLTAEFGKGFAETSLKLMRLFYLQNQDRIRQPASDEFAAPPTPQAAVGHFEALAIRQSVTDELAASARPFSLTARGRSADFATSALRSCSASRMS